MPSAAALAAQHHARTRAISARSGSVLLQEGVKETIVLVVREQQSVTSRHSPQDARVALTRSELVDVLVSLFRKNGTGYIKQFTITREHLPHRVQQAPLL